ncbi:protein kinase [Yinghuangia sp. ASG 101]|uniref:serine/threonine-protein kinase n=1 Tax=Yinghuangia sp. ASG 101 TaxID=2896848 RepID=UPI001E494309|nr:serine/threonine-protein kinase [Yinghuangia sp. ASG 101]UGQ14838.1 protein kinase [Yinghuangia sp. ASG 101]
MEALRPDDPQRLGPYRLRGRLGEGGMGEVFLGVSPSGLRAAVKTVRPEYAHDPGFRDRFRHEVAAARRVDSAWTAPIAEADPDSDPPWLATEYLTGLPLQDAVATYGPLPERAVRVLAAQLVEALMAIHRAGLVHRDLKPSNVILGRDRPRVIDFGISRAMDFATHTLTTPGSAVGSPGYMAPEQATSGEVDQRTDIFALGGVLVYAATGHTPFGRTPQNAMQLLYQIIQGEPQLDGVPDGLRDLIAECLAKTPEDRPALADILRRTIGDAGAADAVGGTWLPAALTAELIRRQNMDPADVLPTAVGLPGASSAGRPGAEGATGGPSTIDVPAAPAVPEPRTADDAPTNVLGAGDARTRVASETHVIGAPPRTAATDAAPPHEAFPRPRGVSRRGFLIGGAVAGVGAVSGVTGWLLSRGDTAPTAAGAWVSPAGQVKRAYSVVVDRTLCVVGDGGVGEESGVSGTVVAMDATSGRFRWQRSTAARHVAAPVSDGKAVFVLAWTDADGSKSDTRQCTLYAFAVNDGTELWKYEFPGTEAYLPRSVGKVLVLSVGPKSESTSDEGTGKVIAFDAANGTRKWEYRLPSTAPYPMAASVSGTRVTVACQPTSPSSNTAVVRVFEIDGDGKEVWSWTAAEEQWCWGAVSALDTAFVRSGGTSTGSSYDENRTLVAFSPADNGPKVVPRWRTTGLPPGWGPDPAVDPVSKVVVVLTGGDDTGSNDLRPWIQAFDAANGGLRWQNQPKEFNLSDPTIHESTLYVACWPSSKQSGNAGSTGSPTPTASPSAAPEGGYVKSGAVYAYDIPTGSLRWRHEIPRPGVITQPQIVKNTVCFGVSGSGGDNAVAVGLDAATGEHRWSAQAPARRASGPAFFEDLFHMVASPAPDSDAKDANAAAFRVNARSKPTF